MRRTKLIFFNVIGLGTLGITRLMGVPFVLISLSAQDRVSEFVFVGDSLTEGYRSTAGHDYPSVVMTQPHFAGLGHKTNLGVGGWKVADIQRDYTTHVRHLSPIVTGRPGYLFVMIGVNDLSEGATTLQVTSALAAYWATAKADGWIVTALTIVPANDRSFQDRIVDVNSFIRSAHPRWDRLVDTEALFLDTADLTLFYPDRVHLNDSGYAIIASAVSQSMGSNAARRPTTTIPR